MKAQRITPVFPVLALLAVCLVLAAGCGGGSAKKALENKISSLRSEVVARDREISNLKTANKQLQERLEREAAREVTVYFMRSTPGNFVLVPEKRLIPAGADPVKAALEELIKGPFANSGLQPTLPKGTKLLGVKKAGSRATVDFNAATKNNLNVGSSGEAMVIGSIVNTLTEFPEIKEVQILIEGKATETLAGHIDISQPLKRNEDLIQ